jgi:hypothetical protein
MNFDIVNYTNLQFSKSTNASIDKPKLVDNGVKYFFREVLKNCHNYKQNNFNTFYNITMFILFIIILGLILVMRYKGNSMSRKYYEKSMKDKEYIMSKLVYYNRQNIDNQQKIKNNMITNLPDYGNHVEANILHRNLYFS